MTFHRRIETTDQNQKITLDPAVFDDLQFINSIRNDDSTRKNLRNTDIITLKDTQKWFEETKPNWFIIKINDQSVGYIRTSHNTKETICIGCDIHPNFRQNGYAYLAYKTLLAHLYEESYIVIWLEVFKTNERALSLYKRLNFIEVNVKIKNNREAITMVHLKMS